MHVLVGENHQYDGPSVYGPFDSPEMAKAMALAQAKKHQDTMMEQFEAKYDLYEYADRILLKCNGEDRLWWDVREVQRLVIGEIGEEAI
jgi:hypothetical protein